MNSENNQNNDQPKFDFEWLFQFIASVSWLISVFVYGSFELGDCLQLLAASAWTVANLMNFVNKRKLTANKN